MFEKTKSFCNSFIQMGVPCFDLAVYKDGECVLRHMGGYTDVEHKTPVKGDERYYIYSCSKPITCVAAMQLWEKGLFSLDDKLSDYMPEFAEMTVNKNGAITKAENPIQIKHLFEMTAGFSYDLNSPQLNLCRKETENRCPTREVVKYLAKEPLIFEPGERYNYSLCHDVLAALVEVISGQKFEEYVKQNIFVPLNMNYSTFILENNEKDTLCKLYQFGTEKSLTDLNKKNWYAIGSEYASGGAGCVSTVDDYIKFLEALRKSDKIIKTETLKLMTTNRLTKEQAQDFGFKNTHGYGLGLRTPLDGGIFTDFGWGGAAGAYLAVDIENGISIYHAQHLLNSPNQALRNNIYPFVMAELTGKKEFKESIAKFEVDDKYTYTY